MRRWIGNGIACAVVVAASGVAWAQDYTVTTATGKIETRPAGATPYTAINSTSAPESAMVNLPFTFPYYGRQSTSLAICCGGWVAPGATIPFGNGRSNGSSHGQDTTSGGFPFGTGGTYSADGVVAPLWCGLNVNDSQFETNPGQMYTWTTGTAPNRHFVVSWENVSVVFSTNPRTTIQCHLYEGSGRIVFAYANTADAAYYTSGTGYVCGLDSPGDLRFTAPLTAGRLNQGYPGSDFVFDPVVATFTGTLLYDRIVTDSSGIGPSVESNVPIPGARVELQRSDGSSLVTSVTAANGSFSFADAGLASSTQGQIAVFADNVACRVLPPGGSVTSWTAATSISFAGTGSSVGTRTLGASADPNGDVRAALNVARVCGVAYAWASARTADSIPKLDVVIDAASPLATRYQQAVAPSAPSMRIASRNVANSDVWDDAIVMRTYAQHVLASIAGPRTTPYDDQFDAVTDKQNAFAQAFGYYLWAVTSGTSTAVDGTSSNSATVHDLETPTITVQRGEDVAGSIAGALYDLADGANETIDTVDGTSVADRVFLVADSMSVTPVQSTFRQAWADAGYDAVALTRVFIGNKVLVDDAIEPNDSISEPTALGTVGVLRKNLVLNTRNEDWFSVTLPAAASSLMADAKYDPVLTGADVAVEIRTAAGALVAAGTLNTGTGAVHAVTGAIAAGDYRVGVRHVSGGTVPTYDVQVYVPPSMDAVPVTNWTLGRPYDRPLGATDGVAPYSVSASSGALPPGLAFDAPTMRVFGTPTTIGSFQVTVKLTDAGSPANVVQRSGTATIHDVLKIAVAPFVGFPLGKPAETTLPTTGGTLPFTLAMTSGALPSGLVFDPNSLHVTGVLTAGPSSAFALGGIDVAGSADQVTTRGVVAHPSSGKNVVADLVAGEDACGWWFDAALGSKVSFTAATAKGHVKRVLAGLVLAPDRTAVVSGKIKTKLGSLTGSGFVCPASGRYYVIASTIDGEATQLLGNVHVLPPKSGKSKLPVFAAADTTTVEVGAVPGATLTLKFAGEKKTGLVARVVSVTDPTGTQVPFVASVKTTAIGGTLTLALPVGGTWTVVLGATSTSGVPGKLSYSYAIKQPKGGVYSAD